MSKRKRERREREVVRNLDWCHVALGDLKVREGRGGETGGGRGKGVGVNVSSDGA